VVFIIGVLLPQPKTEIVFRKGNNFAACANAIPRAKCSGKVEATGMGGLGRE
jgi:hypothetical protein